MQYNYICHNTILHYVGHYQTISSSVIVIAAVKVQYIQYFAIAGLSSEDLFISKRIEKRRRYSLGDIWLTSYMDMILLLSMMMI